jgi:hypothetical protein
MRLLLAEFWLAFASWRAFRWLTIWSRRQAAAEAAQKNHLTWLRRITGDEPSKHEG